MRGYKVSLTLTILNMLSVSLQSLQKKMNGKLEVVYCDFFKMDPRNFGIVKPPIMISETLFRRLGIEAVPWSEGNVSCLDGRVYGRTLSGDCGFPLT